MPDNKYCYPNSAVLRNKLNITDKNKLFEAEKELTAIRLRELQGNPVKGTFDFKHLKTIHKYIFQDIYDWAGMERTVEIGKGNLFCTTSCIQGYAESIFNKYYSQCYNSKDNYNDFIRMFADNYGDLNALHPFREGNGRAQREFARMICLECGYDFNLSVTTHFEMLKASKLSFDKGDSSGFVKIFSKAVVPVNIAINRDSEILNILTSDDLIIDPSADYNYYDYNEHEKANVYDIIYQAKISEMNAKKKMSDAKQIIGPDSKTLKSQTQESKQRRHSIKQKILR